jgi:hypothetical protein
MSRNRITVECFEHYDDVDGASYFAGTILVESKTFKREFLMPYQRAKGIGYQTEAKRILNQANVLDAKHGCTLGKFCMDNDIDYSANIEMDCTLEEVRQVSKDYNKRLDKNR